MMDSVILYSIDYTSAAASQKIKRIMFGNDDESVTTQRSIEWLSL